MNENGKIPVLMCEKHSIASSLMRLQNINGGSSLLKSSHNWPVSG
jgi:hypothetical protein